MDNDITKLQWAKTFMDSLANGVDPVNNTKADTGTLYDEQVISCFRYISDLLAIDIYKAEKKIKVSNRFYITDEQSAELKPYSYNCKVSELAVEINRVTEVNNTKKFSATWINDWLEVEGYLRKSELNSRIATEKGMQLGITSEYHQRDDGYGYYLNLYAEQAQSFVFNHLSDIIAYKNKKNWFQSIKYPPAFSLKDFVQNHSDKCFILSIGNCNSVEEIGSYIAVLLYRGKSKVLKKSNIATRSIDECVLIGILDAASAIKSPTEVVILSSTQLGFNTRKGMRNKWCQEIYRVLTEKGCHVFFSICRGERCEFTNFIKSLI